MERCFDEADILNMPDPATLPADDPRRRHLDECPKCRGLAEARGVFLDPGDTSDLEGLAGADAELRGRLEARLAEPVASSAPAGRTGWRRPWLALAAVLALCVVGLTADELLRMRDATTPRVGDRMRGLEEVSGLTATVRGEDLQLAWPDAPLADSYVFVLLDAGLSKVGRHRVDAAATGLSPAEVPFGTVFCQALAMSHGDTLARSAIVRIQTIRE